MPVVTFHLMPQTEDDGCIPACALSILAAREMTNLHTEATLVATMRTVTGSGFAQLRAALLAANVSATLLIATPAELLAEVQQLTADGTIVIACLEFPPDGRIHCIAIESVSASGDLHYHDPDPKYQHQNPMTMLGPTFLKHACGDIAYFL
jgi:hypothetical protein